MMYKADLLERLRRLDEDADLIYDDSRRFQMIIVGGSALVLLDVISRSTQDIDALNASREIRDMLEKYDINCRVMTYINNFPYNYEDRAVRIPIDGKKIDFFTASLEDIVIAKLFSDRDTDARDIESAEVVQALDWEKLEQLAADEHEVKNNALNERAYNTFQFNYGEYVRRFRPCAN